MQDLEFLQNKPGISLNKNPWLDISISDYVNHMSSPEVGQYQLINECFRTVLNKYKPNRIFVPGCTIGNGFEHINWGSVKIVTALDINPDFLAALRDIYPLERKLELINEDLQQFNPFGRQFDLIFAALFFEYVDLSHSLKKLREMMDKSSILVTLIQLPGKNQSKVTKTMYKSLEQLSPYMNLITKENFENELEKSGFSIISGIQKTLDNGKSFQLTESTIK